MVHVALKQNIQGKIIRKAHCSFGKVGFALLYNFAMLGSKSLSTGIYGHYDGIYF